MSNGRQQLRFDEHGFSQPVPIYDAEGNEITVGDGIRHQVFHKDSGESHGIRYHSDGRWEIEFSEPGGTNRVGTMQGGLKSDTPKRERPDKDSPPDDDLSLGKDFAGFGQSLMHGLTAGFADEIIGLFGERGKRAAQSWEANRQAYEKQHGGLALLGEIAGGVGGFALGGAGARAAAGTVAGGRALAGLGAARAAAGARTAAAARAIPGAQKVLGLRQPATAAVQQAKSAVAASPRLNKIAQATGGIGRRIGEGALIGGGYGGLMAGGEVQGDYGGIRDIPAGFSERFLPKELSMKGLLEVPAAPGAYTGAAFGGAMPVGLGLLGFAGRKAANVGGGTISRFRQKIADKELLGGVRSPAKDVIAREEAAASNAGSMGIIGSGARALKRTVDVLKGRGSVTASPERTVAREMIENIKATIPEIDDVIAQIRRAGGKELQDMGDDEVLMRFGADLLEEAEVMRPGSITATIDPVTAKSVSTAAADVIGQPQTVGLLQTARTQLGDLTDAVATKVTTWGDKVTGGRASGARRSWRQRQEARSKSAKQLYSELDQYDLTAAGRNRIERILVDHDVFRPGSRIGKELEDIYRNIVNAKNFDDATNSMKPPAQRVGVDAQGKVIPLSQSIGKEVLNKVGQAEDVLRAINQAAEKLRPTRINKAAGTADAAEYKALTNLKNSITKVLDDLSDDSLSAARKSYYEQSHALRAYEQAQQRAGRGTPQAQGTLDDLADEFADVQRVANRSNRKETAEAYQEGYLNTIIDKVRVAASEAEGGATPESVITTAREYLYKLFPKDRVDDLIRELEPAQLERGGLLDITKARARASQADPVAQARQAAQAGTFGWAKQFQALIRSGIDLISSGFSPKEAQRLATVRLGQLPAREGMGRLADVARYDQLRSAGMQNLGRQSALASGVWQSGAGGDISMQSPLEQAVRRRGLLTDPPARSTWQTNR